MLRKFTVLFILIVVVVLLAACGSTSESEIHEVTFTAANNAFSGPDTLSAGWAKINLVNEGPEPYHVQFVKLEEGKTVDELVTALEANPELFPNWATPYGGPNAPDPGGRTTAYVNLDAGSYALIDVIPDAEGSPHFLTGMTKSLTVTLSEESPDEPQGDVTIELNDFSFATSGTFAAGEQTIRFNNMGIQTHEAVLVKLEDGKTADDYLNTPPGSPPPAISLGGITGIAPGAEQYINAQFEPGNYALFCFFPDSNSRAPHFVLGMLQEFTIE